MARILIIDDDILFCEMLRSGMELRGHTADVVHSFSEGYESLRSGEYEVAFLDVRLPDGNGIELVGMIGKMAESPEIIMITAAGDPAGAELAITSGAWDYIRKPASLDSMVEAVERALSHRARIAQRSKKELDLRDIVGKSQRIRQSMVVLAEAADTDASVLIMGETGTGKELFARAIHRNSRRASGPFITVDCAALSQSLIESELFGHQRGAFTGAVTARTGLIRQADGGTLFLDEVGELPMEQQRTFLRVLQERSFRPIGSQDEMTSNFRLVAATNRNLWDMVSRGVFRQDLLYRLQGVMLTLPPLRERTGDITLVAGHHASRLCDRHAFPAKSFSPAMLRILEEYPWPGNVRELVNVVESLVLAARDETEIMPEHLSVLFRAMFARARISTADDAQHTAGYEEQVTVQALCEWKKFRQERLDKAEVEYLGRLLLACSGHITRASEMAGLSRQRLYTLLRKHGMIRQWNISDVN